jgi:hypothetical protein
VPAPDRPSRLPAARRVALALAVALVLLVAPARGLAEEAAYSLAVPYRGQLDGSPYAGSNCGPAALAMVLAAYGRDVSIAELRAMVNDLQGTWGDPEAGTAIENLAVIARSHGLTPLDLAEGARLRRWTLDDVRRHLAAGHPVVPQVWYRGLPARAQRSYNGDHYIVLVGYAGDEFIYHDPIDLDGVGPAARITAGQLERAWRESDLPFAALAFAGPAERPSLQPTPTPAPTATPPPTATPAVTATVPPMATPPASATPPPSPTATPAGAPGPVVAAGGSPGAGGAATGGPSAPRADRPALPGQTGPVLLALLAILLLAAHLAAMAGRLPPAWRAETAPAPRPRRPAPARPPARPPAPARRPVAPVVAGD